jgi:hypothetical protein
MLRAARQWRILLIAFASSYPTNFPLLFCILGVGATYDARFLDFLVG